MGSSNSTLMSNATITLPQAESVLQRFQAKLVSHDALRYEYRRLNEEEAKVWTRDSNFPTGHKYGSLNRYSNVLPVETTIFPSSCKSDASKYFGANMLDATQLGMRMRFVVHQAPVPESIPAFWDAVYETRPPAIVMLTRLTEGGRNKADQYWPPNEDQSWEMPGGLIVTNLGAPKPSHITLPPVSLGASAAAVAAAAGAKPSSAPSSVPPTPDKNNGSSANNSGIGGGVVQMDLCTPTRAVIGGGSGSNNTSPPPTPCAAGAMDIVQTVVAVRPKGTALDDTASGKVLRTVLLRYEGWPDFGVPNTTGSVQKLFEELDIRTASTATTAASAPDAAVSAAAAVPTVFVHCSAGIGRTGTFVGAYICRDLFRRNAFDPDAGVMQVVQWLKQRRVGSVQQAEQYIFLHKLLNAEMGAGLQLLRQQQPQPQQSQQNQQHQ